MIKQIINILRRQSANILLIVFPLLLVIPNILLNITEEIDLLTKITNFILPLGVYTLLVGLTRKIGRTILFFIPIIMYSSLQIILLYLYGESIIAVDMFISMITSNIGEARELLGNLLIAIVCGWSIYLPTIILAIILIYRHKVADMSKVLIVRKVGTVMTVIGLIALCATYIFIPKFDILKDVFPINVINNTATAISRTYSTYKYYETSRNFNFEARSTRGGSVKEVYVLVIGETSRAENWQLFGYKRPTNPLLSQNTTLLKYPKVLSECNTTYKSVPLMLAPVTTETFGDSIYTTKSIITAFNQVGYHTCYLSNQSPNRSFIDFFSHESDVVEWLNEDGKRHYDSELVDYLEKFISASKSNKIFVILHTYGSHFKYNERYLPKYAVFKPDNASEVSPFNRDELLNAYDNSIIETDRVLNSVINILDSINCISSMIYVSDHGEDIFDDKRNRLLHSSPVPTYHQLHVPMVMWMSEEFISNFDKLYDAAKNNQNKIISSNLSTFDTLLMLAGITTNYFNESNSIVSSNFNQKTHYYLNDYNESISITSCGLKEVDMENLNKKGLLFKE